MSKTGDLTYYHDINFEWLASYLYSQLDVDLFQMMIQPIGIFARHVNHDVGKVRKIDVNGLQTLKFELNRDGIYDNLPHGLFHKSLTTQSFKETSAQVLESIKIENEKEKNARSFFQIFENEILKSNVVNRLVALDVEKRDFGFAFDQLIQLLPFETKVFEREELIRIMQLFPFLNNVYKDLIQTLQNAITYILSKDSQICFFTRIYDQYRVDEPGNILGNAELGWSFCLGETINATQSIAKVSFHAEHEEAELLSSKIRIIAEWVLPLFYTIELDVQSDGNILFTLDHETSILN